MKKLKISCALLAGALLLAGCSGAQKNPYTNWEAPNIYSKGHTYLQKGDNSDAITAYQALDAQYPFETLTQHGDLEVIYAYYESDQPILGIAAATRYISIYPSGPGLDYAYYLRGVMEFENGRRFLQRHTPYDMSKHDSDNYVAAFNDFNVVVTQFPNSPYTPDARRRMVYLNNTLAQYQLNVAKYYFDRKAYEATISRARQVILYYSNTPATIEALSLMQQSYAALGIDDAAHSTQQVLEYNQGLQDGQIRLPAKTSTSNAASPKANAAAKAPSAPAKAATPAAPGAEKEPLTAPADTEKALHSKTSS